MDDFNFQKRNQNFTHRKNKKTTMFKMPRGRETSYKKNLGDKLKYVHFNKGMMCFQ